MAKTLIRNISMRLVLSRVSGAPTPGCIKKKKEVKKKRCGKEERANKMRKRERDVGGNKEGRKRGRCRRKQGEKKGSLSEMPELKQ